MGACPGQSMRKMYACTHADNLPLVYRVVLYLLQCVVCGGDSHLSHNALCVCLLSCWLDGLACARGTSNGV